MAATLALVAAFLFALAATLQQKGSLNLPTISLADPKSLVRLAGQTTWLIGTLALFTGYLFQAGALDRGRLSIIQPLLVTTVVFALPLGRATKPGSPRSARGSSSACWTNWVSPSLPPDSSGSQGLVVFLSGPQRLRRC